METKIGPPQSVRLSEWLGVTVRESSVGLAFVIRMGSHLSASFGRAHGFLVGGLARAAGGGAFTCADAADEARANMPSSSNCACLTFSPTQALLFRVSVSRSSADGRYGCLGCFLSHSAVQACFAHTCLQNSACFSDENDSSQYPNSPIFIRIKTLSQRFFDNKLGDNIYSSDQIKTKVTINSVK